ncbi:hypothetical protein P6F26_14975 [Roseibacterium sp. SDUM158017]|uniref:hypothetical protein n=1 Tax=Roseicyclus salinarum TaxID=3036773 RepID=UPI002415121E|nr:hypothetical protein [Roseibacterium sp. SDUM158017]MDG4649746.1 hypothetical protein [Roseibacterium sp. SDUM158017]
MTCYERIESGAAGIDRCLCGAPQTQAAMDRIEADISRRQFLGGTPAVVGLFAGGPRF